MTEQIEAMHDYVDIYQVGARNSQNFNLLDALGEVDKPDTYSKEEFLEP